MPDGEKNVARRGSATRQYGMSRNPGQALVDQMKVGVAAAKIGGIVGAGVSFARLDHDECQCGQGQRRGDELKPAVVVAPGPLVADSRARVLSRSVLDRHKTTDASLFRAERHLRGKSIKC